MSCRCTFIFFEVQIRPKAKPTWPAPPIIVISLITINFSFSQLSKAKKFAKSRGGSYLTYDALDQYNLYDELNSLIIKID